MRTQPRPHDPQHWRSRAFPGAGSRRGGGLAPRLSALPRRAARGPTAGLAGAAGAEGRPGGAAAPALRLTMRRWTPSEDTAVRLADALDAGDGGRRLLTWPTGSAGPRRPSPTAVSRLRALRLEETYGQAGN